MRKASELIKKFNAGHAMTEEELKKLAKWSADLNEHIQNELKFNENIKRWNP